jgi:Holliday junction resolvase RusA-like endonuclease
MSQSETSDRREDALRRRHEVREIAFVVFGHPQAKGSKRGYVVRRATGQHAVALADSNRNAAPWQAAVRDRAGEAMAQRHHDVFRGPVAVRLIFCFQRPKSHFGTGANAGTLRGSAPRFMSVMPDVDKCARTVCDGLIGVVIADDALIAELVASKRYSAPERVEVEVAELAESGGRA